MGRSKEMAVLHDSYESAASAFIPVYGRRRVGKSELILQSLEGRRSLYFLGKSAPAQLQLREFLQLSARVVDEPLLANLPNDDWKGALLELTRRWRGDRMILVLDEFQWMAEASPELPSVLQELWDRHWKRAGNVTVVLCGSFIGFMEREVLGKKSPLFGRRTGQILLRPFEFREAAEFVPGWSRTEQARAYFVLGGVPLYLRAIDQGASMAQNIARLLLPEHAPLFREPDFLVREELREVDAYFGVLLALASGARVPSAIAAKSSVPQASLPYYLNQLIELGYVTKAYPLTGKKPSPRAVRYVITDPLLRFWFRFVFPNLSFIQQAGAEQAMATLITPELEAYFGTCFEDLCRRALPALYRREGIRARYEIGEYWDKNVQIDVVGHRDDGWTDLGECKWGAYGGRAALQRELASKIERYPNQRGATIGRRYFVRTKPRGALDPGEHWYGLDDLYEA